MRFSSVLLGVVGDIIRSFILAGRDDTEPFDGDIIFCSADLLLCRDDRPLLLRLLLVLLLLADRDDPTDLDPADVLWENVDGSPLNFLSKEEVDRSRLPSSFDDS